jgi:hypothetical protein
VSDLLRVYAEAGEDGYPPEWHASIKHRVRAGADDRCVRCHHPFIVGATPGEWSRCDWRCTHGGEVRYRHGYDHRWIESSDWPDVSRQFAYDATHTTVNPTNSREVLGPLEVEAHWRVLTVHHLDGNKLNCRWWNLAALCQRCHLQVQGKVRMERRWLHEHSEWFQPYVAGYYAWTYLGEDLARPEVEARLDELLALEDRQLELGASG